MNLFPKFSVPYYIYSPSYTHTSSGVRTLHLLCHALNEQGMKAYIIPTTLDGYASNPHLNTPLLRGEHLNFYLGNYIAVYPDIVKGNPLNAKRVVRYLLAPAGAYGGDAIFSATDNIWGALPSIAEKVLRIPVSDPSIFFPGRLPLRQGTCFYAHKYEMHGNQLLPITKNSIRLEGSLEQIADTLRHSEVCYLYELSSIITEAALCNRPVELIRTSYFNTIDPSCMMGNVIWNDGEVVKKCDDFIQEYMEIVSTLPAGVEKFIEDTQAMA